MLRRMSFCGCDASPLIGALLSYQGRSQAASHDRRTPAGARSSHEHVVSLRQPWRTEAWAGSCPSSPRAHIPEREGGVGGEVVVPELVPHFATWRTDPRIGGQPTSKTAQFAIRRGQWAARQTAGELAWPLGKHRRAAGFGVTSGLMMWPLRRCLPLALRGPRGRGIQGLLLRRLIILPTSPAPVVALRLACRWGI